MLHKIVKKISGKGSNNKEIIKGKVILMKKNVLDFNDFNASIIDGFNDLLGKRVSFQFVSAVTSDPANGSKGKLGKASYLEKWVNNLPGLTAGESAFEVNFEWSKEIGIPGAITVKNEHSTQFYLKTITLYNVPGHNDVTIDFICNSWVYPSHRYNTDRLFFTNKTYLPSQTPAPLSKYREEELEILRGDGEGKLEEWDRVYDYEYYNDLGEPDKGEKYVRPVLGGSSEYPYPRRGRTGRSPTKTDPKTESRLPLIKGLDVYVPRDERFGHLKMADFLGYGLKSVSQDLAAGLESIFDKTPTEFDSFEDVLDLYEGGIKIPGHIIEKIRDKVPLELLKAFLLVDGAPLFKLPMPDVIKEDKSAWRTDEEFAREMLAGVNPVLIRRLEEFPPASKLNPETYGNQNSTITKERVEPNLEGLTVHEALHKKRLFILDHHDALMPYVTRINETSSKVYATRTVLFLQDDGTLKPLAIELSLPHPEGDQLGAISRVFTPAHDGVESSVWQLAKAYVAVSDSGYHQLISHWSQTHAVIEPFLIATYRQLSVLHPIYKLLQPHFRYTMDINALARQILLNAEGLLEKTVFPGKYAMEWSSSMYKTWVFTDQALPMDLVKRGMAEKDSESPHGYKLILEDYPYAVDGLEIWSAIEKWVKEYCSFYYRSNDTITSDTELQSWWKDIVEKGHGDKKDEKWWPKMNTFDELTQTLTKIIWIASALHAALNFGQYPYAGYNPNRPTISRKLMPQPNTPEYEQLKENPDGVFLKTITNKLQALIGVSLIELLSRHSSDEIYLGQREDANWTVDSGPLEAFERFGKTLVEIEDGIIERNKNGKWKNRVGPVKLPYTLLFPTGGEGLTGRGIPNSTTI